MKSAFSTDDTLLHFQYTIAVQLLNNYVKNKRYVKCKKLK